MDWIFVPPHKVICWKANLQWDGPRRWDIREVIRPWGWSPQDRISAILQEKETQISLSACIHHKRPYEVTEERLHSELDHASSLILDFHSPEPWGIVCCLNHPHLWYSVVPWKKKKHNLKVENCVLFGGQNGEFKPRTQTLICSKGPLWRGKGGASIYRSFCNKDQVVGTSKDYC